MTTTPLNTGSTLHQPPPGAGFMNALRWALFVVLLLLAVVSIASYVAWRRDEGRTARVGVGQRWHCPMHPAYTSDRAGDCPICGMALVPIPANAAGGHPGDVSGLTTVELDQGRVQAIGVRLAVATRASMSDDLELAAFLSPDESRVHTVQLRVAGWIQALHVDVTGQHVSAGQPLVTLYSPELFQSESEFVLALQSGMGADAVRERLRLLGVPDAEVARLERDRTPSTRLTMRAPVSGTVLERLVTAGQSVGPDTPLMVLGDLTRPWVLADVYELDLARVTTGAPVTFTSQSLPGRSWRGRVEFLYPTVSGDTRTMRARIALDGDTRDLRPGLFGSVRVAGRGASALQVPTEAVVHTGEQDYVFLARAGGRFEPRLVRTGREAGERVEVLQGLAAGDTVVASASFLIDSESRMQAAIAGLGAHRADTTTGAAGHGH